MIRSKLKRMEPRTSELEAPERSEGERSEPQRSAGASNSDGVLADSPAGRPAVPDPEVSAKHRRRLFTAQYKRAILAQADAGREEGAIGTLLRRQGLYSSHLTTWRGQREQGTLQALTPKRGGRKSTLHPLAEQNRQLRTENARLVRRLEQAEIIIDVQNIQPAGDCPAGSEPRREQLMTAVEQLAQDVGRAAACRALSVPRASLYR